jgi:hypothetical protein
MKKSDSHSKKRGKEVCEPSMKKSIVIVDNKELTLQQ